MRIGPLDQLPLGTWVRVHNELGQVVKAELKPAHPVGEIVVHTIEFSKKVVYLWGEKFKVERLKKKKRKTVNYAFILVLEGEPKG